MKQRRKIILLSLASLIVISLIAIVFLSREKEEIEVVEADVKGSETLNCDDSLGKVEESLTAFSLGREWYLIEENKNQYSSVKVLIENDSIEEESLELVELGYLFKGTEIVGDIEYDRFQSAWATTIPVNDLQPGNHELVITAVISGCDLAFSKTEELIVSHPVYVTWTMDWEGFDVEKKYLDSIASISQKHSIPVTQFFNPYVYLNLSENRSKYLTSWVLDRQIEGDSIGLHLHMNNKMVKVAGVTPKTDVSWGGWAKDGQDIPNTVYGYNDYKKIVEWGQSQFVRNGLPLPTMYRAGGWYIDEENLQVLEELGFVLDSSGRTFHIYGDNKLEGPWDLQTTTQPFRLNSNDQNITNNPNMELWEFPNNGGDSWAYSALDLIARFNDNYKGGVSDTTKVVTYLSHPHWFNVDEPKIKNLFEYTDKYSILDDKGPVVYTTLDKIEIN